MTLKIRASANYLPKRILSAEELDEKLLLPPGTCRGAFGVDYRHVAGQDENALQMGGEVVVRVLSEAGMQMGDIDLLIWASATSHQALPYNAAGLLAHLNIDTPIASLDINSSCLSFLNALDFSNHALLNGRYKNIMIVSSELATVGIKDGDVELSTMFADGAAAFIVSADSTTRGMLYSDFKTYPQAYRYCQIRGGGSFMHPSTTDYAKVERASYFEMEGKEIYKYVARYINEFVENGLKKGAVSRDEIKYVIPHQASASGLKHLQRRLSFSDDQFINMYAVMGNQVAVSLPMVLHSVLTTKETRQGDIVLLIGSGAGLSLGLGIIEI